MQIEIVEASPDEGRWVWQAGVVRHELLLAADGITALAAFVDGEIVRLWEEAEGSG